MHRSHSLRYLSIICNNISQFAECIFRSLSSRVQFNAHLLECLFTYHYTERPKTACQYWTTTWGLSIVAYANTNTYTQNCITQVEMPVVYMPCKFPEHYFDAISICKPILIFILKTFELISKNISDSTLIIANICYSSKSIHNPKSTNRYL